jgi:glycosyltransferase involved in cell wall biosynthesis
MADWLRNVIGIPADRILQIYNGIDGRRFAPGETEPEVGSRPGKFIIGTVGRLDPIKNHKSLMRALKELIARQPVGRARMIELVIVGDGPLSKDLKDYALELGVADCVRFAGPSDNVPAQMRSFDVFVLPSMNEGISNTILEAMASGLPVLATRVGGNPELVLEDQTGTLVPSGDDGALTSALEEYLRDEGLRKKHGTAGRRRALDSFSLNSMVTRYCQLYRAAFESTPARTEVAG